jgi:hypothetical protein
VPTDQGSSSNLGAIVGGIVGGVAAILAALVAWCCWRRRRAAGAKPNIAHDLPPQEKPQVFVAPPFNTATPEGGGANGTGTPEVTIPPIIPPGSWPVVENVVPDDDVSPAVLGGLVPVLGRLLQQNKDQHNSTTEVALVEKSIASFAAQHALLAGKYILESGRIVGQHSIVCPARKKLGDEPVMVKFFVNADDYYQELRFFEQSALSEFTPGVHDAFAPGTAPGGSGLPACIVMEKGDYSLSSWLSRLKRDADEFERRSTLYLISKAVAALHANELVHGDLKPANIMWFTQSHSWKLIDFGSWAAVGHRAPLHYTLRYAAPEVCC